MVARSLNKLKVLLVEHSLSLPGLMCSNVTGTDARSAEKNKVMELSCMWTTRNLWPEAEAMIPPICGHSVLNAI